MMHSASIAGVKRRKYETSRVRYIIILFGFLFAVHRTSFHGGSPAVDARTLNGLNFGKQGVRQRITRLGSSENVRHLMGIALAPDQSKAKGKGSTTPEGKGAPKSQGKGGTKYKAKKGSKSESNGKGTSGRNGKGAMTMNTPKTAHPTVAIPSPPHPKPTERPTTAITMAPTAFPTSKPVKPPTPLSTSDPTNVRTLPPRPLPTSDPTKERTLPPRPLPTSDPTKARTLPPTGSPSVRPSSPPSGAPSPAQTNIQTADQTGRQTADQTNMQTADQTGMQTAQPTATRVRGSGGSRGNGEAERAPAPPAVYAKLGNERGGTRRNPKPGGMMKMMAGSMAMTNALALPGSTSEEERAAEGSRTVTRGMARGSMAMAGRAATTGMAGRAAKTGDGLYNRRRTIRDF